MGYGPLLSLISMFKLKKKLINQLSWGSTSILKKASKIKPDMIGEMQFLQQQLEINDKMA
jgi:hypothetical protein